MDKNVEILLNSQKNVDSVNVDTYEKIELTNNFSEINEYEIRNVLSATEIFDAEREANEVYRIYGKIEYMSLLNGLKTGNPNGYKELQDFFLPQLTGSKSLLNSFDFYLVKASTGYTQVVSGGSNIFWIRYYDVIATPSNFELYPVGFANNVYGEQAYAFSFNMDFDVSTVNYLDNFGFPATELFLYAQYKLDKNGHNQLETFSATTWNLSGVKGRTNIVPMTLNIGDQVKTTTSLKIGDLIEYSASDFQQVEHTSQTFYITTPYKTGPTNKRLIWKYNPLIPFRLRYFSEDLYKANSGDTAYEVSSSIPYFATEYPAGTGNFVWRNILPQGFFDPLTGIGVDYPFVNKKRYLFSSVIFDVIPDLNDAQTLAAFNEIKYGTPTQMSIKPIDDIANIDNPCL